MIEYATADMAGTRFILDNGDQHTMSREDTMQHIRNSHANYSVINRAENRSQSVPMTAIAAAFLILTDAQAWIYQRALVQLVMEGKKVTTLKLAMRIQKLERANTRMTSAPIDRSRDVDSSEYDGVTLTRRERMELSSNEKQIAQSNDDAFYDWTHARGLLKRGFSGVRKQAAIPSLATITRIDPQYAPVRARMIAERQWILNTPSASGVHTCAQRFHDIW